jgi:hypothetical protein
MIEPTYLRYVYDKLNQKSLSSDNASNLPYGFVDIYEKQIDIDMSIVLRRDNFSKLLYWALFKDSVSILFVSKICSCKKDALEVFIQKFSNFFNSPEKDRYKLYHERLRIYILQKSSNDEIVKANNRIIDFCKTSLIEKNEFEKYALQFLGDHLLWKTNITKDFSEFISICLDKKYIENQYKKFQTYQLTIKNLKNAYKISLVFNEFHVKKLIENFLVEIESLELKNILNSLIYKNYSNKIILNAQNLIDGSKEKFQISYLIHFYCLCNLIKMKKSSPDLIKNLINYISHEMPHDKKVINHNSIIPISLTFELINKLEKLKINCNFLINRIDDLHEWGQFKIELEKLNEKEVKIIYKKFKKVFSNFKSKYLIHFLGLDNISFLFKEKILIEIEDYLINSLKKNNFLSLNEDSEIIEYPETESIIKFTNNRKIISAYSDYYLANNKNKVSIKYYREKFSFEGYESLINLFPMPQKINTISKLFEFSDLIKILNDYECLLIDISKSGKDNFDYEFKNFIRSTIIILYLNKKIPLSKIEMHKEILDLSILEEDDFLYLKNKKNDFIDLLKKLIEFKKEGPVLIGVFIKLNKENKSFINREEFLNNLKLEIKLLSKKYKEDVFYFGYTLGKLFRLLKFYKYDLNKILHLFFEIKNNSQIDPKKLGTQIAIISTEILPSLIEDEKWESIFNIIDFCTSNYDISFNFFEQQILEILINSRKKTNYNQFVEYIISNKRRVTTNTKKYETIVLLSHLYIKIKKKKNISIKIKKYIDSLIDEINQVSWKIYIHKFLFDRLKYDINESVLFLEKNLISKDKIQFHEFSQMCLKYFSIIPLENQNPVFEFNSQHILHCIKNNNEKFFLENFDINKSYLNDENIIVLIDKYLNRFNSKIFEGLYYNLNDDFLKVYFLIKLSSFSKNLIDKIDDVELNESLPSLEIWNNLKSFFYLKHQNIKKLKTIEKDIENFDADIVNLETGEVIEGFKERIKSYYIIIQILIINNQYLHANKITNQIFKIFEDNINDEYLYEENILVIIVDLLKLTSSKDFEINPIEKINLYLYKSKKFDLKLIDLIFENNYSILIEKLFYTETISYDFSEKILSNYLKYNNINKAIRYIKKIKNQKHYALIKNSLIKNQSNNILLNDNKELLYFSEGTTLLLKKIKKNMYLKKIIRSLLKGNKVYLNNEFIFENRFNHFLEDPNFVKI